MLFKRIDSFNEHAQNTCYVSEAEAKPLPFPWLPEWQWSPSLFGMNAWGKIKTKPDRVA